MREMTTTAAATEEAPFEGYAIIELFGHRKVAGYVTVVEVGGTTFFRVDVPTKGAVMGSGYVSQLYATSALYSLTPTTEQAACLVAERQQEPTPVGRWELPVDVQRAIAALADAEASGAVTIGDLAEEVRRR